MKDTATISNIDSTLLKDQIEKITIFIEGNSITEEFKGTLEGVRNLLETIYDDLIPPLSIAEEFQQEREIMNDKQRINKLEKALKTIVRWQGEFPNTNRYWDKEETQPMSYSAAYGSNGERDFMRNIAKQALDNK